MSGQKKLSLFKDSPFGAPASKPDSSDDDSDTDFFSQSKRTYALLAAQEEERKKRKAEQATVSVETSEPITPPSQKKQKTSRSQLDASSEDLQTLEEPVESQDLSSASTLRTKSQEPDPQNVQANDNSDAHDVIELESDGSSVEEFGSSQRPASLPPQESVGPDKKTSEIPEGGSKENPMSSVRPDHTTSQDQPDPPDAEANAVISILITSDLPDTSPLIVQRKLGQRLKEPRLEWCRRQDFDDAKTASVILTFRGKHIYDSTTCRALGIGVDESGNMVKPGEKDVIGDTEGRIHMLATTREMLKQLRETQTQRPAHVIEAAEVPIVQDTGKKVRLILKSKGREDMKLMVKETHLISKLVNAYRNHYDLEELATSVSIHFDGEELDPGGSVASYDINDLDTLDVYEK